MKKGDFFKLMKGTWVEVVSKNKDDIMGLLENLGYSWLSGDKLNDNDWCGTHFYIRLYKSGKVCYSESIGLDCMVIVSYQDLCKHIDLKLSGDNLFDEHGNLQGDYTEDNLVDVLRAMGCNMSDDGDIISVNYSLINYLKSWRYSINCDFFRLYTAIQISLGSGQSPYYVLDRWL